MEITLLETLVEDVRGGLRADNGFKQVTWNRVCERIQLEMTQRHPTFLKIRISMRFCINSSYSYSCESMAAVFHQE